MKSGLLQELSDPKNDRVVKEVQLPPHRYYEISNLYMTSIFQKKKKIKSQTGEVYKRI